MIPIRREWSAMKRLALLSPALATPAVEDTATGNPVVFITDLAKPLKQLQVSFTPVQTGSGDPSPVNQRPIVPWDGLKVWHGGKNLFDKNAKDTNKGYVQGRYLLNTGATDSGGSWYISEYISVVGGSKLSITNYSGGSNPSVCFYDSEKQFVSGQKYNSNSVVKVTVPATAKFMRVSVNVNYADEFQIEVGKNITEYEPYKPITETDISFPSPVYGGTLDAVTGVLTVEYILKTLLWSDGQFPSDRGDVTRKQFQLTENVVDINPYDLCNVAPFKVDYNSNDVHFYVNGTNNRVFIFLPNGTPDDTEITIATKLVEPQTVQLAPQQITALKGENTIWSDGNGSMTAVYLKKK